MKCVSPIYIPFQHPFLKGYSLRVPCGKCKWCLEKRQKEWAFRIYQEAKYSASYFCVTLTYDNEHLPRDDNGIPVLCKKDVQLFNKRLREDYRKNFKSTLRFFAVGEYGGNFFRPHYHIFYFTDDIISYDDFIILCLRNWNKCDRYVLMRGIELPKRGMMYYVAQYSMKSYGVDFSHLPKKYRPFMICSNRPAIGDAYLTPAMIKYHRDSKIMYGCLEDGIKTPLPRYYRDKIWSKKERKAMFSKLLLDSGNIPHHILDKFIETYEDEFVAFKNMHDFYDDEFRSSKRLYKNKRKI